MADIAINTPPVEPRKRPSSASVLLPPLIFLAAMFMSAGPAGADISPAAQRRHRTARRTRRGRRHAGDDSSGRRGVLADNVGPITGRAGTEPRSTDRNYTAGPIRCIGG